MTVAMPGDGSVWERAKLIGDRRGWLLRDVRTGKVWAAAWPTAKGFWNFKWEAFGVSRTGMSLVAELGHLFAELETALGKAGAPVLHPIRRPNR